MKGAGARNAPLRKCSGGMIERHGRTECAPTEFFRRDEWNWTDAQRAPLQNFPATITICAVERKQSRSFVQSKPVDCGVQGAARSLPGQGQSPCGLSRQSLDRSPEAEPLAGQGQSPCYFLMQYTTIGLCLPNISSGFFAYFTVPQLL